MKLITGRIRLMAKELPPMGRMRRIKRRMP